MAEVNSYICPNCQTEQAKDITYCSKCGQKNQSLKPKFIEFISEFFNTVFNLDNKFFQTVAQLFIPAKLSRDYFKGIRQKYHHPLKIYFMSILVIFFILSLFNVDDLVKRNIKLLDVEKYKMEIQKNNMDQVFEGYKQSNLGANGLRHLDSVYQKLFFVVDKDTLYLKDTIPNDVTSFTFFRDKIDISERDLALKTEEELVAEIDPKSWLNRIAVRQISRISKDLSSLNAYIFANLTWLFLALIPIFAIIMKLFYIRRNRYFVEHIVFLLHLFAVLTIYAGFLVIVYHYFEDYKATDYLLFFYVFFPYFAFKKYYGQGWFRTLFKFMWIGFFFVIAFTITFLIFILVSALFY